MDTECIDRITRRAVGLEFALKREKRTRRNAEKVAADAIEKRNQAEAARDAARAALRS